MKKFLIFLAVAVLLGCIATGVVLTASAANTERVIYISSAGTGDGSSPSSPLGNAPTYASEVANSDANVAKFAFRKNALYLAYQQLLETGGRIVVVGELVVDSHEFLGLGHNQVADFILCDQKADGTSFTETMGMASGKTVTITAKHNNVDYGQTSNAKIIVKHDSNHTTCIATKMNTVWDDITFVTTTAKTTNSTWSHNTLILGSGCNVTFGNGFKTELGDSTALYPIVVGGTRKFAITANPVITINGGKFDQVYCSGYGQNNGANTATITGNVKLNVNGGEITTISGTGTFHSGRQHASVVGNVDITVNGGKISKLCGCNAAGIKGVLTMKINGGEIQKIYKTNPNFNEVADKAPTSSKLDFSGFKGETKALAKIFLEVKDDFDTVSFPAGVTADQLSNMVVETSKPVTTAPTVTKPSSSVPTTNAPSTTGTAVAPNNDSNGDYIGLIVVIAAVVVVIGVAIVAVINKKKAK